MNKRKIKREIRKTLREILKTGYFVNCDYHPVSLTEYWYTCLTCGRTDWCASYSKFERNKPLKDCKGKHTVKEEDKKRGIDLNEEKRYVLICEGHPAFILNGQKELAKSFNSNLRTDADRYYELGPEVKVVTTVEVVPAKPVYRSGPTSKRTEI